MSHSGFRLQYLYLVLFLGILASCHSPNAARVEAAPVKKTEHSSEQSMFEPCQADALPQDKMSDSHDFAQPGEQLPIAELTTIEGQQLDLSQPGQRKLVILFATWCSDSQRALNALKGSPLLEQDLTIIAIAREEDQATVEAFAHDFQNKIAFVADPEREIYSRFAESGVPWLITVDEDNRIVNMNLAEGENQLSLIQWN